MKNSDLPSLKKTTSDNTSTQSNHVPGIKEVDLPGLSHQDKNKQLNSSLNEHDRKDNKSQPKTSFTEKVKIWATNLNFKLENEKFEIVNDTEVHILGRVFSPIEKTEILSAIKDVIWFSYRERFPSLLPDIFPKAQYTSDRGWGCMLRCGQMLFAEAIKRHFRAHGVLSDKNRMDIYFSIIYMFSDSNLNIEESPFSIQQIAKQAYENFGLKPGEWYRASSIMGSLSRMNQMHKIKHLQNFKVVTFIDGTIFEDQILAKAMNKDLEKEKLAKNEEKKLDEDQEEENEKWKNSVLVFVASKTGLDHHNEIYLPSVLAMLSFPESIGMLSGQDARAYFFLGCQGNQLMYLDPHFVQESLTNFADLTKKMKSYFVDNFFAMNISQMDTSIGLGFYIKNEKHYVEFKNRIYNAMESDPNFLIGFEIETPSLDRHQNDLIEVVDNDGSFEIIN